MIHRPGLGPLVVLFFCAGILIACRWPPSWWWAASYLVHFLIFSFGIGFGLHRNIAHHVPGVPRSLINLAALVGSLGQVGSPLTWRTVHYLHHAYSDTERDPHSPRFLGPKLLLGYTTQQPKDAIVEGILAGTPLTGTFLISLHRYYYLIGGTYAFLCFVFFGWRGLAHLALIPMGLSFLSLGMLNYFGHRDQDGGGKDLSRNVWWLWPLTFGENWHHNHHQEPRARSAKVKFFQLDLISFYFVLAKRKRTEQL